jgi:hypothetical protein
MGCGLYTTRESQGAEVACQRCLIDRQHDVYSFGFGSMVAERVTDSDLSNHRMAPLWLMLLRSEQPTGECNSMHRTERLALDALSDVPGAMMDLARVKIVVICDVACACVPAAALLR